jgi:two-component system OmpR family response regulator
MGAVLVIDESLPLLEKVQEHLGAELYTVYTAADEAQARAVLDKVGLVIIDFHMPGEDGASMLASLRRVTSGMIHAPLLYLHTTDSETAAGYKQMGFDGVIGMKGNLELLSKQVSAAMRLRRLSVKLKL